MDSKSKKLKWVAKMMTFLMTCTLIPNVSLTNVKASERNEEYKIYPIPQNVQYKDAKVSLTNNANVIFDNGIDNDTKNRIFEILSIKGISYEVSTEIKEEKTNFLIGINNSDGIVDNYFKENNLSDDTHFENFDSYILSASDNIVGILGKDTDAAFYGITSLKLIFEQIQNSEMRSLLIKDFSDGQWRGFIEGYYGIPWSHENRKSLMEFGGDFKMNAYIFAPKDDEYHSLKWREPYPTEKLAEIAELVEVGAKTKNKFIWTIHPFLKDGMNFSSETAYQEDLEKIIAKFEQLYNIGVRQFGVLADDAEGEALDQVKLMNDLEAWRLSKGDIYNLIFVPKVYTKESAGGDINNEYLKTIGTMPETIDIMWTGDVVMGYVTEETFDFFEKAVGRQAFMWLNWPVNDINNKRLLMGKGEMLDSTVKNFKGIVTNPMQEAQASKPALFAIADYGWNRASFDVDRSWKDSFEYIEPDASEELYTFAKHMSDPTPNWHGLALEESEELAPIIEEFTRKLWAKESIIEYSDIILAEYQEILDATNNFAKKSKNDSLKNEIKGWVDSLRDLSESTIEYINAAIAFEQGDYEKSMRHYDKAEDEYIASRSHRTPVLNGQSRPEPGIKYLIPFAKDLSRMISDNLDEVINNTDKLTLRPYTNMGPNLYWGHIQNIVDGDNSRLSCMWVRRGAKENDYVAVELSELTKVKNIIFEQGEPGAGDSFNYVKFQYSIDGVNWKDINGIEYGPQTQKIVVDNLDIMAKYIRVVPTGELKGNWISIRELAINKDDKENMVKDSYTNVSTLISKKVSLTNKQAKLENIDKIKLLKGQYVGIKLDDIKEITSIINDSVGPDNLSLESSINGIEWEKINDLNKTTIARYIRLINNDIDSVEIDINNLEVNYTDKDVKFNVSSNIESNSGIKNLVDGKLNTSLKLSESEVSEGYISYQVSERTDIDKVSIVQNPKKISNATVSVRTEKGWTEIGILEKNINEFDTSNFKSIFEIKVEWNDIVPQIHEVGVSRISLDEINISKITNLKAEEITNNSVKLVWNSPKSTIGLEEYIIYKDGKEIARVPAIEENIIVSKLRKNSIFGFKVVAKYSNNKFSKPVSLSVRTEK